MTPTGSEQVEETRGKAGPGGPVYPLVYPSQAIEADELLRLWSGLDDAGRRDLLAVARGLAAKAMSDHAPRGR